MVTSIFNKKIHIWTSKIFRCPDTIGLVILPSLEIYYFKKTIVENSDYTLGGFGNIKLQWLFWEIRITN